MALSKLLYQKYDSLNSLSVAVIILLLVNPLYLFGIGFILSVSAVLGIILLNYNFSIILSRLPWSLRNSLSVTLSAQITTIPALLLSFGYISVAGLLLNIIIIPIMSFLFVIILVATLLCTIVPLCGFVLPIVCLPLQVIINLAVHIGFEKAVVSGFGGWWLVVIALFIIIAISDKFNIKKLARLVIMSVTVCAFTFVSIFQSIMPINSARVIASAYYNGGVVIIKTHEGAVLVVTEDLNTNKLSTTLNKYGVTDLSSVIILGGDECLEIYFDLGLTASNIYLSQDLIGIESVGTNTIYFVTDFSIYGVDYKFYDSYSIVASYDGVRVGISAGEYQNIPNVDLLFSVYECEYKKADTTYYFNRVNDITSQNNIYDCGDLQFAIKNGTIK
jgi:hypothetical protein